MVALPIKYLPHYPHHCGEMKYANPGDSGFDLYAAIEHSITIHPGHREVIACGFAVAVPEGCELQVRPRSGLAFKKGLTVLNSPGTVDSGYRGEVKVLIMNTSRAAYEVQPGERIAQAVIAPVLFAEFIPTTELPESQRGQKGFGSTGI